MNKILIVEDNKTLAKLIATKIKVELNFEVDVAYSLKEAKLFLKMYKYFLVLTDLNLTDAPNGEIVDYTLSKGHKVIVLSGNINKEFRKKMLEKNIIDYINKGAISDIDYVITTINRLLKNQKHKVLVVDASMNVRKQMKDMLENLFFKVITVAHGEEALGMLNVHPDISLVLTDYKMPVIDGLELTKEIRKEYDKNTVKIIATSSDKDAGTNALFLKHGANDYLNEGFSKEEFSCRIHNSIEALENIQLVTNQTNRDSLTGLYNRRFFLQNMDKCIKEMQENSEHYALAIVDIDAFTSISKDVKNQVLTTLADIIRTNTKYQDMVARFSDDEFYVLIKDTNLQESADIFNKILQEVNHCIIRLANDNIMRFTVSIGLAIHKDDTFEETISQADMMLYNAKQNGGNQLVFD